jgi:hypothetical protein
MSTTQQVVIVGGGTAGWLTAARLGAMADRQFDITLVESPNVPTVGVGEGTWPSMKATLQAIGLSERVLISECDASLKQGTLFQGWRTGAADDSYLHPFSLPPEYASKNVAEYWRRDGLRYPFHEVVTPQTLIATTYKAPKTADTPDYAFALNYGYHVDAVKFAALLRQHSISRFNVRHVEGHVAGVSSDAEGFLMSLELESGDRLFGDFFVDCSGQRALLIGEHFKVPFQSARDVLPNNRAVVAQVPYDAPNDEIHSCTQSTAQDCGWIWDIGLQSRRGVGYVHNADFISEAEATQTLRNYAEQSVGAKVAQDLACRTLNFEPGYRGTPWTHNCVAVGLSAGFIEPLEASALAMIEQAASFLVDSFPVNRDLMGPASRAFNRKMESNWASIQEFLKLHYVLSDRDDTPYWQQARDETSISEGLSDKLALWQIRAPWHPDTPRIDELFPAASYQYVWLGMNGHLNGVIGSAGQGDKDHASSSADLDPILFKVRERALQLSRAMPGNRQLLNALRMNNPSATVTA